MFDKKNYSKAFVHFALMSESRDEIAGSVLTDILL